MDDINPGDASASHEQMGGIEISNEHDGVVYYSIDPDSLPEPVRHIVEHELAADDINGNDERILGAMLEARDIFLTEDEVHEFSHLIAFMRQAHDLVQLHSFIEVIEQKGVEGMRPPRLEETGIQYVLSELHNYYATKIGFSPDAVLEVAWSFINIKTKGIPEGITLSPTFLEVMSNVENKFTNIVDMMHSMIKRDREALGRLYSDQNEVAMRLFQHLFILMANNSLGENPGTEA